MLEPDIARKCMAALAGTLALAGGAVFASWWLADAGGNGGAGTDPAAAPSAQVQAVPAAEAGAPEPTAWRSVLETEVPPERPTAADRARAELQRRALELERDNARLRARLDDMLNWILDNVQGTFPLAEEQMSNLRLMPVDETLGVSADLAQVLRLNNAEVERLDAAFEGTRQVLWDIEAEGVMVETPSPEQVRLAIPPYPEEGELVREVLYDELAQTLGAARFDRFLQVAGDGLEERFEYFGDVDRLLEFEAMPDDGSGLSQLFVRDERVIPDPEDPLRQNIIASERIVSELPEEYWPYRDWLPETVTRFTGRN